MPAQEELVDLDLPLQGLPLRGDRRAAQFVQHRPRRLVGSRSRAGAAAAWPRSADETSRPDTRPRTKSATTTESRASRSPPSPTSVAHNRRRSIDAAASQRRRRGRRTPGRGTRPAGATRTRRPGTPPRCQNAAGTPRSSTESQGATPREATKQPKWSEPGTRLLSSAARAEGCRSTHHRHTCEGREARR